MPLKTQEFRARSHSSNTLNGPHGQWFVNSGLLINNILECILWLALSTSYRSIKETPQDEGSLPTRYFI